VKRLLALLALAAAACSSGKPRGPMSDGERMYLSKCTACHSAYEPGERSAQSWVKAMDDMERLKKTHLKPGERALILSYLTGDPAGRAGAR
jgi:cytochrome c5